MKLMESICDYNEYVNEYVCRKCYNRVKLFPIFIVN